MKIDTVRKELLKLTRIYRKKIQHGGLYVASFNKILIRKKSFNTDQLVSISSIKYHYFYFFLNII